MLSNVLKFYKSITLFFLILFATLSPASLVTEVSFFDFPHRDKLAHFVLFGLFMFFSFFDYLKNVLKHRILFYVLLIFFAMALGGFTELMQKWFIVGREGDWWDLMADFFGIFVAIFIFRHKFTQA